MYSVLELVSRRHTRRIRSEAHLDAESCSLSPILERTYVCTFCGLRVVYLFFVNSYDMGAYVYSWVQQMICMQSFSKMHIDSCARACVCACECICLASR